MVSFELDLFLNVLLTVLSLAFAYLLYSKVLEPEIIRRKFGQQGEIDFLVQKRVDLKKFLHEAKKQFMKGEINSSSYHSLSTKYEEQLIRVQSRLTELSPA